MKPVTTESVRKFLGNELRSARAKEQLSQTEAGAKIGHSSNFAVCQVENGLYDSSFTIDRLCKAFQLHVEDLLVRYGKYVQEELRAEVERALKPEPPVKPA